MVETDYSVLKAATDPYVYNSIGWWKVWNVLLHILIPVVCCKTRGETNLHSIFSRSP